MKCNLHPLVIEDPVPGEIALHTEIFRTRPEVHSVVHAHPHATTALTTADKTVFAITPLRSG